MKDTQPTPWILGFYGRSGIGKTYLVKKIVAQLVKEGFQVAVVKVSDKAISIDTKGKDTFLYGQAGAGTVIFSSAIETAFLIKEPLSSRAIVDLLRQNKAYEYIFIEGALEAWIPKVRLGDMPLRENTVLTYAGDYDTLFSQIKNKEIMK